MQAFASIDPHKGKFGVREARRLIEEHGVKGFKFHPTLQGFSPMIASPTRLRSNQRAQSAGNLHSGHSGIGTGMPGAEA